MISGAASCIGRDEIFRARNAQARPSLLRRELGLGWGMVKLKGMDLCDTILVAMLRAFLIGSLLSSVACSRLHQVERLHELSSVWTIESFNGDVLKASSDWKTCTAVCESRQEGRVHQAGACKLASGMIGRRLSGIGLRDADGWHINIGLTAKGDALIMHRWTGLGQGSQENYRITEVKRKPLLGYFRFPWRK